MENKEITITDKNGLRIITLNRPKQCNAITAEMYTELPRILNEAGNDESVKITVLTGAGDYYCSGNDLKNFNQMESTEDIDTAVKAAGDRLRVFVEAFITHPKILVAVINGPAIGIAATSAALCDIIYASDKATFNTPFVDLGQAPEACSSYTFPKIMGNSLANEVLILGRKLTAKEAFDCGLVSRLSSDLNKDIWPMLHKKAAGLNNPVSAQLCKKLVRKWDIELLKQINKAECELLTERWVSDECLNSVFKFLSRKSKL